MQRYQEKRRKKHSKNGKVINKLKPCQIEGTLNASSTINQQNAHICYVVVFIERFCNRFLVTIVCTIFLNRVCTSNLFFFSLILLSFGLFCRYIIFFCSLKIRRFAFVKQKYVSQIYLIADSKKKIIKKKEKEMRNSFIIQFIYLNYIYCMCRCIYLLKVKV